MWYTHTPMYTIFDYHRSLSPYSSASGQRAWTFFKLRNFVLSSVPSLSPCVVQSRAARYRNWSHDIPDGTPARSSPPSSSDYPVFPARVFASASRFLFSSHRVLSFSLPSGGGREFLHALGRPEWLGPAGSPPSGLLSFWRASPYLVLPPVLPSCRPTLVPRSLPPAISFAEPSRRPSSK